MTVLSDESNDMTEVNPNSTRGRAGTVVSYDRGTGVIKDEQGHEFTVHVGIVINPRRDIAGRELRPGDRVRFEMMGIGDQTSWVYRLEI